MNKLIPHWACYSIVCSTATVAQTPAPHLTPTAEVAPAATPTNQASDETKGSEEEKSSLAEVVVTGTLIRGIAPAGANVISVGKTEIENLGAVATGTDALLNNTVPQLGEFNNSNFNITASNINIQVDRPNLRNLPGLNTAGGSTTLILVDGHRLVGSGVLETAADADMIPPALIQRVEVILDGGSAIYGSDAVGGVINFITKQHFEGSEVDGHVGFANDYRYYDASGTVGHDWGSGGAYLSYSYNDHTPLFGYDRGYVRQYSAGGGPAQSLNCVPGNAVTGAGTAAQVIYGLPGLQPNTPNYCDTSKTSSFIAFQERNSVFAGLNQDLIGTTLRLEARGYYTKQIQENFGDFRSNATIRPTNPFYMNLAAQPGAAQTVYFDWGPLLGDQASRSQTVLQSWGATPTIIWDVGQSGWQVRAMSNYGGSVSRLDNTGLNATALAAAAASTNPAAALDPYNVALTNPSVIAGLGYKTSGVAHQALINERVVGDGAVFALPGGDVHLAVGTEFIHEYYNATASNLFNVGTTGSNEASRNSYAFFGETNIPVFSDKNALPGIAALSFNAAGRYDHYSDFGHTLNPQFSGTYEPVNWIKLRGKWGTSFNAPSLADTHAINNNFIEVPAFIYPDVLPGKYNAAVQSLQSAFILQGGLPGLRPQTATTWEAGTDITPPFVPDLTLKLTYYHIFFKDIVSTPDVGNPFDFFTNYTGNYLLGPTAAQVNAFCGQLPGGTAFCAPYLASGVPVYSLEDVRRSNFGNAISTGLDYGFNFSHRTSFGSVDVSVNGTYALTAKLQATSSSPFVNELSLNTTRSTIAFNAGANIGAFRAAVNVDYSGGFAVTPVSANGFQTHVGDFAPVNLFFSYDLGKAQLGAPAVTNNLLVSLAITNVGDITPPLYRGAYNVIYNGYTTNGATVGREFEVGVSKKF
jgi:iron complex outermembrane receptor protein